MKDKIKKIVSFSIGTWYSFALAFIISPVTTFLLAPEEFGKFSLFSIVQLFLIFILGGGQDQAFIRFYYKNEYADKIGLLKNILITPLIIFVLVSGIVFLFNNHLNYFITGNSEFNLILACQLLASTLLALLVNYGLLFLRMQQKAGSYSTINILTSTVNYLTFFLYLFFIKKDFNAFIFGGIISNLIPFFYFIIYVIPIKQFYSSSINKSDLKQFFKYGVPFVPVFVIDYFFNNSDKYFLRYFGGVELLGVYSFALRISTAFSIIQTGFHMFWVPYSQEKYNSDSSDKNFYHQIFSLLTMLLSVFIIGVVTCKDIITFLIDPKYFSIIHIFPFLMLVPFFHTLSEITFVGINFKFKTTYHLYINVIALVINLSLGFFIIGKWGIAGAAINSAVTHFCFFILRSYFGYKFYPLSIKWKEFGLSLLLLVVLIISDFIFQFEFYVLILFGIGTAAGIAIINLKDIKIFFNVSQNAKKLEAN